MNDDACRHCGGPKSGHAEWQGLWLCNDGGGSCFEREGHSPRPWSCGDTFPNCVYDSDGRLVADASKVWGKQRGIANARLIVTAISALPDQLTGPAEVLDISALLSNAIREIEPPDDPHSDAWTLGFCRARKMAADLIDGMTAGVTSRDWDCGGQVHSSPDDEVIAKATGGKA